MSYMPKVLIVDDEPRMCNSLKTLLNDHGYEAKTAYSGKEAIERLAEDSFDLALVDIVMPDMSGHEIMDHINSKYPATLVIVMTGHATLESAVKSLRRWAYDYLRKPFDFEQLLRRVKNALDQNILKKQHELLNGKLELTERQYRFLVNASPDIIYTLNPEGEFTFVNGAIESLLGYKGSELVGKHYTSIVFEDDIDKAKNHFNERRTGRRATHGLELRLKPKYNGNQPRSSEARHLAIELKSMGIYDRAVGQKDKEFYGTYGVARDITDRERLKAQLLQAQKMEAIGTLAGGIAHDFNNLLMGIEGRTSLMALDIDSDHPHAEHLKAIEDMVKKGATLTRQLLGFARRGKYEVKPTDLNDLVEKCSEMFGRTKKEIKIYKKYQEEIWMVEADQSQMEQVLLNLYVNAWQAMPDGGNLYIKTENVTLDEADIKPFRAGPGNYVKLSVTDTGVGMDEETRRRIFDPFFTTKEMHRGTGLGLASVYGIIKNHGGMINVFSKEDQGTTFDIFLPAVEIPISEHATDKPEKKIERGHETILLVDDEDMIIEVVQDMLTSMGYNVLPARSGKEAIEIYNANTDEIDMVILDMIMPDINGGDVYDTLKEINPEIKVLLSSGYSLNGKANKILERGCNGFIQKPFNTGQLSKALRKILHPDL